MTCYEMFELMVVGGGEGNICNTFNNKYSFLKS